MTDIATVQYYNTQRGFGFLSIPGRERLFFHVSNCRNANDESVDTMREGDRVSYTIRENKFKPGKSMATNVKILGNGDVHSEV